MGAQKSWLVVVAIFVVGVSTPAVARSVVDFARNAHKVDGFHAVGPASTNRDSKLVATDDSGRLPNNIIRKAPNSARLGGRPPSDYLTTCDQGVVVAAGIVPEDPGATYSGVFGYQYVGALGECRIQSFNAKRLGVGTYQVRFASGITCAGEPSPRTSYATVVSVKSNLPLFGSSQTVCDAEGKIVEQVKIFDTDGAPQDSAFTIALLSRAAALP
ncbi:MAG: hypothetical protein M3N53_13165 [Actinomycetota bacterium]|nr:hypothetical protein [Actinomycetota bacterium]